MGLMEICGSRRRKDERDRVKKENFNNYFWRVEDWHINKESRFFVCIFFLSRFLSRSFHLFLHELNFTSNRFTISKWTDRKVSFCIIKQSILGLWKKLLPISKARGNVRRFIPIFIHLYINRLEICSTELKIMCVNGKLETFFSVFGFLKQKIGEKDLSD